ncbi:hypothetical protein [Streptomyces sp. NPDC008121]|uniref:hypothetical protein n=1 Tax=Streptomyces sp. NPDC008121 TaxID=3364809 RepID=UPI0036E2E152
MPSEERRPAVSVHGGQFHGPLHLGDGPQINVHHTPRRPLTTTVVVVAVLAVTAGLFWFGRQLYTSSPGYRMAAEERLLTELVPGRGYYRIQQALGTEPDHSVALPSGNRLHQYEREWETVQVVEGASGTALSVGVYTKDPEFRPALVLGGRDLRLNATTVAEAVSPFLPAAALGYCGAHKGGYLEGYYPMPNAYGTRNVVVGVSNAQSAAIDTSRVCAALAAAPCAIPESKYDNVLSAAYAGCLLRSRDFRTAREGITVTALVHTAPGAAVVPDMLHPPDVVAGGALSSGTAG